MLHGILNCYLALSDSLFSFILSKVELEKIISPQSEKPQEVTKEQGKAPRAELAPAKGLKRRKSSTLFVCVYIYIYLERYKPVKLNHYFSKIQYNVLHTALYSSFITGTDDNFSSNRNIL